MGLCTQRLCISVGESKVSRHHRPSGGVLVPWSWTAGSFLHAGNNGSECLCQCTSCHQVLPRDWWHGRLTVGWVRGISHMYEHQVHLVGRILDLCRRFRLEPWLIHFQLVADCNTARQSHPNWMLLLHVWHCKPLLSLLLIYFTIWSSTILCTSTN